MRKSSNGFTLIELLMVIGIIMLLLALMVSVLMKMRERTKVGQAKNLVEKLHNAIESYNLFFRSYPPDSAPAVGALSANQALNYYLTTPFRPNPDPSKNETWASIHAGPFITLTPNDFAPPVMVNVSTIVDAFGAPIHYNLRQTKVVDPVNLSVRTTIMEPIVYSFGINKVDDTTAGTTPNDDIFYGGK